MRKVLVLGCAGSGKSTFAMRLGEAAGIPVIHLDSLYWKPGWVASAESEWDAVIGALVLRDTYIMDGNYSRTLPQRLKEADTIFFFDFPRFLCLYRVFKRRLRNHGRSRPDMAEDCKEKIDFAFIR
jgi:adenylate kinase family enzyme